MKRLILYALLLLSLSAAAQSNTATNIIEGGKTLVELVRIFKAPRYTMPQAEVAEKKDSCALKSFTDVCLRNNTGKILLASLYRRSGTTYETVALTLRILPKNQEWLYEVKSGIYKLKLETEEPDGRKPFREGEIKLNACENLIRDIKND